MRGLLSILTALAVVAILGLVAPTDVAAQCNVNSGRQVNNSIDPAVSLQAAQIQAQLTQLQNLQAQVAAAQRGGTSDIARTGRVAAPTQFVQAPRASTTATATSSVPPPVFQPDLRSLSLPVSAQQQPSCNSGSCNSGGRRLALPRPLQNRGARQVSISRSVAITRGG